MARVDGLRSHHPRAHVQQVALEVVDPRHVLVTARKAVTKTKHGVRLLHCWGRLKSGPSEEGGTRGGGVRVGGSVGSHLRGTAEAVWSAGGRVECQSGAVGAVWRESAEVGAVGSTHLNEETHILKDQLPLSLEVLPGPTELAGQHVHAQTLTSLDNEEAR